MFNFKKKKMKKILFSVVLTAFGLSATNSFGQITQTVNDEKTVVSNDSVNISEVKTSGAVQGSDFYASYSSKAKSIGFGFGSDLGKYSYMNISYVIGTGDHSSSIVSIGGGLKHRHLFNDLFLVSAHLYPYIGISIGEEAKENSKGKIVWEDKTKFTYGACANITGGIKIHTSKKNKRTFLTLGYYMAAPEFETSNMVKSGSWLIGLTVM